MPACLWLVGTRHATASPTTLLASLNRRALAIPWWILKRATHFRWPWQNYRPHCWLTLARQSTVRCAKARLCIAYSGIFGLPQMTGCFAMQCLSLALRLDAAFWCLQVKQEVTADSWALRAPCLCTRSRDSAPRCCHIGHKWCIQNALVPLPHPSSFRRFCTTNLRSSS